MTVRPEGIRLGVVGVGYWGSRHLRVLRSATGVSSVVGIDQRFTGTRACPQRIDCDVAGYADLAEVRDDIDAVVIATPPSSHARLGLEAIAAGKHVLIEKPMATTTVQARTLVEASRAAGVVLMPGHTFEHNAAVHKLRDLVRRRELGQLYFLDFARLNLGLYQPDVGVILDLAPHDISIANFVLDARPSAVTALGFRYVHPEYEDVAHLMIEYADIGVRASVHVSWLSPQKVRRATVVGSQKMAIYDDLRSDERIRVYDKAAVPPENWDGQLPGVSYHLGDMVAPLVSFAEPLAVQDQHFVDCVSGAAKQLVDGMSGLAVVQVLECAQISLAGRRTVALAEVADRDDALP